MLSICISAGEQGRFYRKGITYLGKIFGKLPTGQLPVSSAAMSRFFKKRLAIKLPKSYFWEKKFSFPS